MKRFLSLIALAVAAFVLPLPLSAQQLAGQTRPAPHDIMPMSADATLADVIRQSDGCGTAASASGDVRALLRQYSFGKPAMPLRTKPNRVLRATPSADRHTPLIGALVSKRNSNRSIGVYSIATDGTDTNTLLQDGIFVAGGAVLIDGYYYTTDYDILWGVALVTHTVYDIETWEEVYYDMGTVRNVATDMAYDETTDNIYGCFWNETGNGLEFGILKLEARVRTTICTLTEKWAMAVSRDGTLYAITGDGMLYTVDKATGEKTLVGDTGLKTMYQTSATFDPQTGHIYYVPVTDTESALYEIDPQTAEATLVTKFADRSIYFGLCTGIPEIEAEDPAAVENLTASFDGASLTGTLTFTAPVATNDGTATMGSLTYRVLMNGREVATGQTAYGQEVSVPVSAAASGSCLFYVTVANDAGSSPERKLRWWVGYDKPSAVRNATLTWTDGQMNLTWDAVTTSLNGGYFDPAAVTYTVTRWPDGVTVADGISGTSFSEPVAGSEAFVSYYYTVTAVHGDSRSEPSTSNSIQFGEIYPPYLNDFSNDKFALDGYTLVNLNSDGNDWLVRYGKVSMGYNSKSNMNAWLITPAIKLDRDCFYELSFEANCYSASFPERVEAFLSTSPTADGMTTPLVGRTDVTTVDPVTLQASFAVEAEGSYYVGIHGCSDADSYRLYIDNLSITKGRSTAFPATVDDLSAVADDMGGLTVGVSFTAPAETFGGRPLASITRMELSRDGQLIHTFDAPKPGARLSFADTVEADGTYTYSVVAVNETDTGFPAEATVFVGVGLPASPAAATVAETANAGEVTIAWEAPAVDVDGHPLNPALVTYTIKDNDGNTVAGNVAGCSYTYMAVPDGDEQTFVRYSVFASTRAGINDDKCATTALIPVGTAYSLPISESFAGGSIDGGCVWGYDLPDGSTAQVGLCKDSESVASQDGDNGFIASTAKTTGMKARILSGKLHVGDEKSPALTFHYYAHHGGLNTIDVQVDAGDGFETVKSIVAGAADEGWKRVQVPLAAYAGRDIRLGFLTCPVTDGSTMLDNIFVGSLADDDLAAIGISLPRRMPALRESNVTVSVENYGCRRAEGYSVGLYRNGTLVQTVQGPAVEAGAVAEVCFREMPGIFSGDTVSYHAVIDYAADRNPGDNATDAAVAVVAMPVYPSVGNLTCRQDGGVTLAWGEPGTGGITSGQVTDSFESYKSYAVDEAGDWMFIDGDGTVTSSFTIFPYTNAKSPMAYIVFERTFQLGVSMHSGSKCMVSCPSMSGKNDDWLISPELAGSAQTVSFYARSFQARGTFEFYYSTTGINRDDFVRMGDEKQVETGWTEFAYDLPEGATYFAIRCTTSGGSAFLVDDVTYTPSSSAVAGLGLVGYNVYRDGVKLNDAPLAEPGYTDAAAGDGAHSYFVTVVYDKGESKPSNVVMTGVAGAVASAPSAAGFGLSVADHAIVITNAEGCHVGVYTPDGRTVYDGDGAATMRLPVGSGVYIVKVGREAVKIVVK